MIKFQILADIFLEQKLISLIAFARLFEYRDESLIKLKGAVRSIPNKN